MLWGIPSFLIGAFAVWMSVAALQDFVKAAAKKSVDTYPILMACALFLIAAAIAFK